MDSLGPAALPVSDRRAKTALLRRATLPALADLLLPVACPGCGAAGQAPCTTCLQDVLGAQPRWADLDVAVPVATVGSFEGPMRALLLAHKERGRRGLTPALGAALAEAVALALDAHITRDPGHLLPPVVLVPVPSRPEAVRDRGEDTVARIARRAALALRARGVGADAAPWLVHTRKVGDQAGLGARARRLNVSGALVARIPRVWGSGAASVIVVDDVVTTGATLAEAVRALIAGGLDPVAAATVAATDRRPEVPLGRDERHALTREAARSLVRRADRH